MKEAIIFLVGVVIAIGGMFLFLQPVRQPQLGAVSGPDLYSPYFNVNGVIRYFNHVTLVQASTTLCNIKSPSASSTLAIMTIRVMGSTTGMLIDIAKSTAPDATTTAIGTSYSVVAGKYVEIQASTSPAAGAATIFPPNNYLVVKAGLPTAGAAGTFSQVGACNATFEII